MAPLRLGLTFWKRDVEVIGISVMPEGLEAHQCEIALQKSVAEFAAALRSEVDRVDPSVSLRVVGGAPCAGEPHAIVVGWAATDSGHDEIRFSESCRPEGESERRVKLFPACRDIVILRVRMGEPANRIDREGRHGWNDQP